MILIVDDEPIQHTLLRALAEIHDIPCVSLYNGVGAAEVAKSKGIKVVFLDIFMERKEGLATLEELLMYCDCYIVTMSSNEYYLKVSKELGAHEAIKKPITSDDFKQVLRNATGRGKYSRSTEGERT